MSYKARTLSILKVFKQTIPKFSLKIHLKILFWKTNNGTKQTKNFRDKAIGEKLIYIPNNDKQNYPSCRLNY